MKIPQDYFDKVKAHYHGDTVKTWAWFQRPNPGLRFYSPLYAMQHGDAEKVKRHIDNSLRTGDKL